jgi:Flp pilus assembly protein TadD
LALLVALSVLIYTRWETLRRKWLETQPTEHLRQLASQSDADTLIHFLYAGRLVEAGAAPDAAQPAQRAVESLSPATPSDLAFHVFALAGYVAAQTGDIRRAEEWLQRAAGLGRDDIFLFLGGGILALRQNRPADAVTALTEATQMDPSRAEAWSRLGAAYMLGAEPERAIESYRRAVTLSPKDPQVHADLAQALSSGKQHPQAREEFRIAAELAPQNPKYAALSAIAAANSARTDAEYHQAVGLLKVALAAQPQEGRLHSILAVLHLRFGQTTTARQALETYLARHPEDAVGWHNLAVACERSGDRPAAATANARYQQLVDFLIETTELKREALLHRDDPAIFLRLAEVCRRAGRNREAYVALEQAAKLRPDDPQIAKALRAAQAVLPQGDAPPQPRLEGAEPN